MSKLDELAFVLGCYYFDLYITEEMKARSWSLSFAFKIKSSKLYHFMRLKMREAFVYCIIITCLVKNS